MVGLVSGRARVSFIALRLFVTFTAASGEATGLVVSESPAVHGAEMALAAKLEKTRKKLGWTRKTSWFRNAPKTE